MLIVYLSLIRFQETRLALIHIPLEAYPLFLQPILQLLVHNTRINDEGIPIEPSRPWMYWHPFVNVSITEQECSIVCPREEASNLFGPVMKRLSAKVLNSVSISTEDYSVILISGEGLDAGQRVLDLTCPLAMADISIFYITSYYSDYILVPHLAQPKVIHVLQSRGFAFEAKSNGETERMTNRASPLLQAEPKNGSYHHFSGLPSPSWTPPSCNVSELQIQTSQMLKEHGVSPRVDSSIELVTCAGVKDSTASASATNYSEGKLQLGITKCLTSTPPPKFFSLTLTDSDSASLTLEKRLVSFFYNEGEDLLLGKDGPEQVPITLDLKDLPLESTGIVCGVASCLRSGMRHRSEDLFNMSYLSTAKAGHVIVYHDELDDAVQALKAGQQNVPLDINGYVV